MRQNVILALEMLSPSSPERMKKMVRILDKKASSAAGH
jgi:hypothetical protein